MVNTLNELDTVLAGVYRPFDAKAWERFSEWNPEAAAWLESAVANGISSEEVANYGERHGYSSAAVNWIRHAATYLHSVVEVERLATERGTRRIIDTEPAVPRYTVARRAE